MLRHTFVTTMLDAVVDLRDVQLAARHADPRTTMRYDRARKNLDRLRTTACRVQDVRYLSGFAQGGRSSPVGRAPRDMSVALALAQP